MGEEKRLFRLLQRDFGPGSGNLFDGNPQRNFAFRLLLGIKAHFFGIRPVKKSLLRHDTSILPPAKRAETAPLFGRLVRVKRN